MSQNPTHSLAVPPVKVSIGRAWWLVTLAAIVLPWLSQPPFAWWPLAAVAVVPLLLASTATSITRKHYLTLYLGTFTYWAFTLQGLRLANPLIYPCWIALAAYLAIYPIAFVVVLRRATRFGIPIMLSAPIAWVGMECIRNYLLTGISAAMLGHTLADVPSMIQIADLGGTYAVSLVLVVVNVACFSLWQWRFARPRPNPSDGRFRLAECTVPLMQCAAALALVAATYAYGSFRLNQPGQASKITIALIGRNEPVEYEQDPSRELELFDAYAQESIRAFETTRETIDAVVWPESMFTGRIPWMAGKGNGAMARELGLSPDEEQALTAEHRSRFQFRATSLQSMLAKHNGNDLLRPDIIGGCGIIDDGPTTKVYSGIVHVGKQGNVQQWYGKMHLVMFGEYIPLVRHIPIVRSWIPKNLGLTAGESPQRFQIGEMTLCPNICIETAVERVVVNQLRQLRTDAQGRLPDAIVTVTNDGWFDDSSIVTHHKRCAQLVAVACRRAILSAANNGPTVWINSNGQVVQQLPQGENGCVIAQPEIDSRTSLVLRIGDWPARLCAVAFLGLLVRRPKGSPPAATPE